MMNALLGCWLSRSLTPALCAIGLVACGGSSSPGAGALDDYSDRVSDRVSALETTQADANGRFERLEAMVDILQAEVSKSDPSDTGTATAAEPAPAPTPVSAPSSSKDDGLLDLANVALGVAEKPVDRDGETFRVDRGWFTRSLEELVRGKTPTLASNRNGGVRLRGIRPKSFLGVLGLRSNDVVMAINGALVNTPAGISRELTDAAGPELRVKVSRKQQETTYTYSWK